MELQHIGIAVEDITQFIERYHEIIGSSRSPVYHDIIQHAFIQFVGDGNGPLIELIQPDNSKSPVSKFVNKGVYHVCYKVTDLTKALDTARSKGGIIVKGPDPAVAFERHQVAFVIFRDLRLIEFVQK
jgi:catechol 2,3-dioxygenase-like lactoylglutathione lyase family enzyme